MTATSKITYSPKPAPGRFNPLKPFKAVLTDVKIENPEVKTYTLQVAAGFPKKPSPGQFNMLGYPGIGEAPISFSALAENGTIQHTIRSVGMATRFMERIKKGGELLIRGPYGRGWPMDRARGNDLVLVAGGVGLAPLRPVVTEVMKRRSDYGQCSLLFGSRNEHGLLFADEYDEWRKYFSFRLTVDELVTKNPWEHSVGLITVLLDRVKLNREKTVAFVCGPEMMMRFVCRQLMLQGIPASNLYVSLERRMKCGVAQCGHCQHVGLFVCKDGPVFPYREVAGLYDGML